jgi:hypothetical protein
MIEQSFYIRMGVGKPSVPKDRGCIISRQFANVTFWLTAFGCQFSIVRQQVVFPTQCLNNPYSLLPGWRVSMNISTQ